MSRWRRGAQHIAVAVLVVFGFATMMTRAFATIDGVSPSSLTVKAGDSGGALVSVTSAEGSCLTATATAPGIEIGVNPGCASAGTPVFSLTLIVDGDVSAGDYRIALTTTLTTTIAPDPGTTLPPATTQPQATLPPTTVVEAPTTTELAETVVIQPPVETGLSPFLTILALLVLGVLAWMLFRVQSGGARVKYRRLIDPERLATIHRAFRDAGQGAPAALRTAGASSSRLDVAIAPLTGPDAPVDVEVVVGAPWSRQRARVVASKTDGAVQLQVQRGEAGLADVPDGEAAAQTWLDGLAHDLARYGDGRGAAAIKRWLQP